MVEPSQRSTHAPESARVLVIGLDGATYRLISPLAAAGQLPNLQRLMQNGAAGVLQSTIQPSSEQAWATFMTGQNNGRHGVYGFQQRRPGTYQFSYVNGHSIRAPSLWRLLSQRGRDVIVINVPMTYPPQPVRGVLIGGLLSPGVHSDFTYPPGLYAELRQACGDYVIDVDIERGQLSDDQLADTVEAALRMIRLRTCATLHLARTRPWDLLMTVYGASDRLAHKFWKHWDPNHPLHTPELAAAFGDVLPRVYRELDAAVGELLAELVDERTTVFIVSDHGFGGMEKAVYLNRWLMHQGYLTLKSGVPRDVRRWPQLVVRSALRQGRSLLANPALAQVKQWAFARFPRLKGDLYSSVAFAQVDWTRTRAYALGNMGNIYLNLQGREPAGIVAPGATASALQDELIAALRGLINPDSGTPVFHTIYRGADLYHGPYVGDGPDIVGVKDCRYHVVTADWQRGDDIVAPLGSVMHFAADQSGQHELEGVVMASGPGVRRGVEIGTARLLDAAATILYALHEPIPADMDSRVIDALFEPTLLAQRPPKLASRYQSAAPDDDEQSDPPDLSDYTDSEAAQVRDRLIALGYLD